MQAFSPSTSTQRASLWRLMTSLRMPASGKRWSLRSPTATLGQPLMLSEPEAGFSTPLSTAWGSRQHYCSRITANQHANFQTMVSDIRCKC